MRASRERELELELAPALCRAKRRESRPRRVEISYALACRMLSRSRDDEIVLTIAREERGCLCGPLNVGERML